MVKDIYVIKNKMEVQNTVRDRSNNNMLNIY